jgi:hypothetical protein
MPAPVRHLVAAMRKSPYRLPADGSPLRLVFVGQSTFFEACSLGAALRPYVISSFIEFRSGSDAEKMVERVQALRPHVVIMYRPELVPAAAFAPVEALTVGFLTEPLPRSGSDSHADLEHRLVYLASLDRGNFDRIVSFDPLIVGTASRVATVWRSLPLPVADRYYRRCSPMRPDPRLLFVGRSTAHRERYLGPLKHRFDLLHVAHGAGADMVERLFDESDIAVNLHNEPYPSFENRVSLHLAAGHLVLSEPLSPSHGLEPEIDYLEIRSPAHLEGMVEVIRKTPEAFMGIRVRGRMKAELFRASSVWPRLIHDAVLDVSQYGGRREQQPLVDPAGHQRTRKKWLAKTRVELFGRNEL